MRNELSMERLFDEWNVQYAIEEMASGKTPGEDGIPSDFYKVIGVRTRERDPATGETVEKVSPLAKLMREAFTQIHASGIAPEGMRATIISLLYKEKGSRYNLKYYRPIGVANAVARIMEKVMVIGIRPLLEYIVSPDQKAFQPGKYIAENT